MTTKDILIHRHENGVLEVILNRPHKRNALTEEMITLLTEAFCSAAADLRNRCVLLSSTGVAFCAGRDISSAEGGEDAKAILVESVNPLIAALDACTLPTIAAVQGAAMGIGLGLCLACDVVYAAHSAQFSSPFARLGGALDSGGHFYLPRLIGQKRALELIYTADSLDGETAARWGLVNRAMPDAVLLSAARTLAGLIAAGPAVAFAGQKKLLRESVAASLTEVLGLEADLQGRLAATTDYSEGLAAFRERRTPVFRSR